MKISSLLKISALVWISSLFWFFLDLFYVLYITKKLFNEVPTIFTIVLLSTMLIGSLTFLIMLGSLITLIFKRKLSKKIKFKLSGGIITFGVGIIVIILFILTNSIVLKSKDITIPNIKIFPTAVPTPSQEEIKNQIIVLTNQEREKNGLGTLTENNLLDQASKDKAEDILKRDYFEHYAPGDPESSTWQFLKQEGYSKLYAGENLGRGYFTASSQIDAWMASKEHKKNILSPNFTEIGVYVMTGQLLGEKNIIVVQEFASPNSGTVANSNANSQLTISQVQSYRDNIVNITPSWESAKSKYPQDTMNKLLDSFSRQIDFCNQIINDYSKNGRFSADDISLWNSVNQMGNETYQITTQLNNSH